MSVLHNAVNSSYVYNYGKFLDNKRKDIKKYNHPIESFCEKIKFSAHVGLSIIGMPIAVICDIARFFLYVVKSIGNITKNSIKNTYDNCCKAFNKNGRKETFDFSAYSLSTDLVNFISPQKNKYYTVI